MSTKVAINGLGRIGRAVLKLVTDEPSFDLVAVTDLTDAEILARRSWTLTSPRSSTETW